MADDTNTSDLASIMAADLPVSPAERDLAHRNRKLRQQGQPADAIVDPRLVSMLAGGGIGSDARMPVASVPFDRRMEQQIQARAMAGLYPTPDQAAYLKAIMPQKEALGDKWARAGQESSGLPQIGRAGSAIGEAAQDPSIPNVANAATQTAMAAFRPALAMKALGVGYAGALANDMGLFGGSQAEAQTAKKGTLPGLTAEQQAQFDAAQRKVSSGDFSSSAERRQTEETLRELRTLSNDFVRSNADSQRRLEEGARAKSQEEYDRQVSAAEATRDKELARDRRFSDTEVGKLWDKTGGLAPVLAGTVTGALSRSATGGGSAMHNYALPAGLGALGGVGAANVPLAYNTLFTEPDNPQKRAMEAYARELPPSHSRRGEFEALAKTLADTNPVREAAAREFYDPHKLAERALMGGTEGLLGGMLGADVPRTLSRVGSSIAGAPGRLQGVLGGRQGLPEPTQLPGGGTANGTGAGAPKPTGPGLSAPTAPSQELVRTLAAGQLPVPAVAANSDDLLRALKNPANRNVPKSAEVKRGKDKLGRQFAKDPDDGRFTSDPDR